MSRSFDEVGPGDAIDQATEWCLRLAEGRLAPPSQILFDEWLIADPAHADAFDAAVRTWQALDNSHRSPELIEMRRSALDSFRRGQLRVWGRRPGRGWKGMVGLAAGIALVTLAGWAWQHYVPDRYQTGPGERRVVALEDGSRVSLDAQSRVDVRYNGDRRELWLRQGRARFQVSHDSLRPFSVRASDKVVVATGTQFSVELLSSQVHVILYQGGVDVLSPRDGSLQPIQWKPEPGAAVTAGVRQVLPPRRELVMGVANLSSGTALASVHPVDPVRTLAWEAGQLMFNDEPLAQAVERMNRYVDRPVFIGDAPVGQIRISGTFLAGDMAAFLEGVTGIFPVRVDRSHGREVLVIAR